MKKGLVLGLLLILLGIVAAVLGKYYFPPRPLLSEEGQSLCGLYQSFNQIKINAAEAKGLIEAREKVLAEQELILPVGKALLEKAQAGQLITIDSVSYNQGQVSADLERREKQRQFLCQVLNSSKIYLGKLEDTIISSSETVAQAKLKLDEAEADKAELLALADYQLVEVSAIKTAEAKGDGLKALLASANSGFEAKLEQIQKSQRPEFSLDVLEENFIPTTFWLRQVMIYQAEAERQRLAAEEERRSREEAEKKKQAAEAEKRRQDEEARRMDKLLIKAEEAERQTKAAEEELRRQVEAERKQKEAEDQRRRQAEVNDVPVCVVDDWAFHVPAFLFINKETGQRIPVSMSVNGRHQYYCVKQMPIGGYHVEIQYDGEVYSKIDVEVTKELSASYNNNWYHCVVKASDGRR